MTGEVIDFDVTGYIERYNAEWMKISESFRAMTESMRSQSSKDDLWHDYDPYAYCEAQGGRGADIPQMCLR